MSLKVKTVRNSMLVGITTLSLRGISMVSTVFLARMLEPTDFGIVAMALVLLSTSNLFSGLGMRQALVQTRIEKDTAAYHAILVTFSAGLALSIVVFTNADVLARLLGSEHSAPILSVMSIIILFQSISLVPEALLQKELQFARLSSSMFFPELLYLGTSLSLAINGFGVWSLAYAAMARSFSRMVLLFAISEDLHWLRPRPVDSGVIRSLLRFGIQSTGSGFISFLNAVMDNLFVGKAFGVLALGYYSKAHDFSTNTVEGFNRVLGSVLFPSYSKIQEDRQRLSSAYARSLRLVSLAILPISTGMMVLAPEFIGILLGQKWLPMVLSLQILSMMCMIRAISSTTSPLFLSMGHPDFDFRAGLLVTCIAVAGMFGFQSWGIEGVAFAFLVAQSVGFVYNVYQVRTLLGDTALAMLKAIAPAAVASGIMAVVVLGSKLLMEILPGGHANLASLIVLTAIGVCVYAALLLIYQRPLVKESIDLLRSASKLKSPRLEANGAAK